MPPPSTSARIAAKPWLLRADGVSAIVERAKPSGARIVSALKLDNKLEKYTRQYLFA
jgi:hypothetical protein